MQCNVRTVNSKRPQRSVRRRMTSELTSQEVDVTSRTIAITARIIPLSHPAISLSSFECV